ncbi:MAG: methyltransferase family protein [Aggregatilineales bacterium]
MAISYLLIIMLTMCLFAVVHSITAGQIFKQRVQQQVGERIYHGFYRIVYNIVSLLMLLPALLLMPASQHIVWQIPETAQPVFTVIQMIGSIGVVVSLLQIDIWRFIGLRQIWVYFRGQPLPLASESLQTGGLYRLVRHPLYFFSLLPLWFITPMTDTMLMFTVTATLYFIIGSRVEEQRMVNVFGEEYQQYQENVPWLLPFVSNW